MNTRLLKRGNFWRIFLALFIVLALELCAGGPPWAVFADEDHIIQGNVGIGTTSPGGKRLKVQGDTDITGTLTAGTLSITSIGAHTVTGTLTFSGVTTDITTGTNEHLAIMPNGAGNVGIGTTSPGYKLEVNGTIYVGLNNGILLRDGTSSERIGLKSGALYVEHDGVSPSVGGLVHIGGGSSRTGLSIKVTGGGKGLIVEDGNVGIGTTSPGAKLEIKYGSSTNLTLPLILNPGYYLPGTATGIGFLTDGDGTYIKGALVYESNGTGWNIGKAFHFLLRSDGNYSPVTLADAKMTITNTGSVGIGTTVPKGDLQLKNRMTLQGVVNTQSLYGNNVYYDGAAWRLIDAAAGAAVRMGHFAGGISFHTIASGAAGADVSTEMDSAGIKMVILNSGNVGIGTTSPSGQLEVQKNQNTGTIQYLMNNDTGTSHYAEQHIGDGSGKLIFGHSSNYSSADWLGSWVYTNQGPLHIKNTTSDQPIHFYTGGANNPNNIRMTILSSGNVGIGTTGPNRKLHITGGDVRLQSSSLYFNDSRDTWGIREVMQDYGDGMGLNLDTSDGAGTYGTAMVIRHVGGNRYVGIGTTGPLAKLEVRGAARISSATNHIAIVQEGSNDWVIGSNQWSWGANNFSIGLNQSDGHRVSITSTGNVGVGTTAPSAKLDVQGTAFLKGINVASYANGGRIAECSGEYPDNYSSPYTPIYNTPVSNRAWSSYWLIDGDPANPGTNTAIDANGEGGVTFFKVTFDKTYVIDRVRLAGRYDNYTADGQPQEFQLDFSDGNVQTFTFPASYSGIQEYNIRPVATSFIRYTTRSKYTTGNNGLRELEAYTRYPAINGTLAEQRNIFYSTAKGSELNANVGIGTASPGQKLTVVGTIESINPGGGFKFPDGTIQGSAGAAGGWVDDGTVVRLGTSSDNVGIGTTAPGYKLEVAGTGRFSNVLTLNGGVTGANPTPQLNFGTYYANAGTPTSGPSHVVLYDSTDKYGFGVSGGTLDIWSAGTFKFNKYTGSTATAGLVTFDGSGNATFGTSGTGTITSGLINGQTISSSANFTGSITGAGELDITGGTGTAYNTAPIEVRTTLTPRIAFHWPGVVASQLGMDSAGIIRTYDNPGTGYERFAASQINIGATNVIDASRNLVNIGTITSGLINSQTISSAANFTGTVTIASALAANAGISVDGNTVIDDGAGWHRTYGATGWYNGTYAGGMYMTDTSYVRTYNSKPLAANAYYDQDNTAYYLDPNNTGNALLVAGNVGIGTTAPGYKLDVAGTGRFTSNLYLTGANQLPGNAYYSGTIGVGPSWLKEYQTFRYRTPSAVEYWNGTSWVAWSGHPANEWTDGVYNDDQSIDVTHAQFRVTYYIGAWDEYVYGFGIYGELWASSFTVKVETSADNITYADNGTYTCASANHRYTFGTSNLGGANGYFRLTFTIATPPMSIAEIEAVGGDHSYETPLYTTDVSRNINLPSQLYVTGNVGIGTTSPGQKLQVVGTIESTSGGFKFPDGTTQASANAAGTWTKSGSNIYPTTITDNVGIGTASPIATLHVNGPLSLAAGPYYGTLTLGSESSTWLSGISQRDAGWAEMRIWTKSYGSIYFANSFDGSVAATTLPSDGMVLKYNKLGIGGWANTEVPSEKLHVKGNILATGTVTASTFSGALSGNATTATTATNVSSPDGDRNPSTKLPTTNARNVRFDFATAASAGTSGNYAGVMTYAPWDGTTASTGDASYQLAFGGTAVNGGGVPQLNIRKGIDSTWNSWYTLLHSGNYNSYAPTLTGTGASGTWPISITGNADTVDGYHYNNLPYLTTNQSITLTGVVTGSGTTSIATSFSNNASYPVAAAAGNGLKFWNGSDTYKISMGSAAEYYYGPVTDYSIKTVIDGNATYPGRGFTWGQNAVTPVAALNAYTGSFQTAGNIVAMGNVGIGTTTSGAALTFANSLGDKIYLYNGASYDRYGLAIQSNELRNFAGNVATNSFTWGYLNSSTGAFNEWARMTNSNLDINGTLNVDGNTYMPGATTRLFLGATAGYAVINRGQTTAGTATSLYIGEPADSGQTFFRGTGATTFEGSVGIGTTGPGAKLQVSGNTYITGDTYGGLSIGEAPVNYDGWDRQLTLNGTSHARITAKTATVRMGMYAHDAWTAGAAGYIGTYTNHPVAFMIAAAQKMVLDTNGNLGIGTTSPGAGSSFTGSATKLDVVGDIHISRQGSRIWFGDVTNANPFFIGEGTLAQSGTDVDYMVIEPRNRLAIQSTNYATRVGIGYNDAAQTATLAVNGNVGIGTTGPNTKLDVSGGLSVSGRASIRGSQSGGGFKRYVPYGGLAAPRELAAQGSPAGAVTTNDGTITWSNATNNWTWGWTGPSYSRLAGRTMEFTVDTTGVSTAQADHFMIGFGNGTSMATVNNYTYINHALYWDKPVSGVFNIAVYESGAGRGNLYTATWGDTIHGRIVLRSTGAYYYVKKNNNPNWELLYSNTTTDTTATLYPQLAGHSGRYTVYDWNVYDQENLAYSVGNSYLALDSGNVGIGTTGPGAKLDVQGGNINTSGNLIAYGIQGNGNVGGTGSASWHPSGIYSAGHNWLYGGISLNGGNINNGGTITATTFSGALSGNATTATNVAWSGVTSKPTTLAGYGITDMKTTFNVSPDTTLETGIYYFSGATNPVPSNDGTLIHQAYGGAPTTWGSQIVQDYRTGRMWGRGRNNGSWTSWLAVLDSGNYNSYAPTLTGTGASGTWPISISGNADTVDSMHASQLLRAQGISGLNVNTIGDNFVLYGGSTGDWTNRGPSGHNGGAILHIVTHPGGYYSDLWFDTANNRVYSRAVNAGSIGGWSQLWSDSNDGSGSGLDADLLDGINSTSFIYSGASSQGDWNIASSTNGQTSYPYASIELRESNFGATGAYTPPRLGFHWGGVVASQIGIESSGRIVILNNPGTAYEAFACGNTTISGTLTVSGYIYKNGGGFQIDHPLDPANKVLVHSFVESPDMKNLYDGVVIIRENGESIIELPIWFEALNKDFRYQLTPIGKPAMPYVKEEIKDNKFVIAGDPGMKVCWQVTGTRKDAYAEKNRIKVEEEKGSRDGLVKKGEYIAKECYGEKE